jgi:hypothetical protein
MLLQAIAHLNQMAIAHLNQMAIALSINYD